MAGKVGKVAVYRGKVAGKWREDGRCMEGRWQVNEGNVAGKGGKVAVYRGKDAGKWRECGR